MVKGIPKWVMLSTQEVQTVLTPVFDEIVKLITGVLKDTPPPELSADIYKHGILLTGGCA